MERRYGWKRDIPDNRDILYALSARKVAYPSSIDLRGQMPPIYDQRDTSSCTAQAIAACIQSAQKRSSLTDMMPSRLFIYYNERVMCGTVNEDSGAYIRDGIKACNIYGLTDEKYWPFDTRKITTRPNQMVYDVAIKERIRFYASVQNTHVNNIKLALSHSNAVIFGFEVYEKFETKTFDDNTVLKTPGWRERPIGGHAALIVGYDDAKKAFLVRNSWGADWGMNGYWWMSYDYVISEFCSDFWVIRLAP